MNYKIQSEVEDKMQKIICGPIPGVVIKIPKELVRSFLLEFETKFTIELYGSSKSKINPIAKHECAGVENGFVCYRVFTSHNFLKEDMEKFANNFTV